MGQPCTQDGFSSAALLSCNRGARAVSEVPVTKAALISGNLFGLCPSAEQMVPIRASSAIVHRHELS